MLYRAPLRVSFFGGGSDLPEYYKHFGEGRVLSAAIDRYAYARIGSDRNFPSSVYLTNLGETSADPNNYFIRAIQKLHTAIVPPFKAFISVDAPIRSGLGGSSAATVALLAAYWDEYLIKADPTQSRGSLAEAAFLSESENNGERIGKQDQYASAFGGLNLISFSDGSVSIDPLHTQISVASRRLLESSLLLVQMPARKASASRKLAQLTGKLSGNDTKALKDLRWAVNAANDGALALSNSDFLGFAELLNEAWERKLRMGYSTSDAQTVIASAKRYGAVAGKECGTGGHVLLLFRPSESSYLQVDAANRLHTMGLHSQSVRFDYTGVKKLSNSL